MYRVIVSSFADKMAAAEARDAFKAKYPNRSDFQGAWLLYCVYWFLFGNIDWKGKEFLSKKEAVTGKLLLFY